MSSRGVARRDHSQRCIFGRARQGGDHGAFRRHADDVRRREFTDEPLPDATLFNILRPRSFAPSGGNRQGWRVIVVRERATREALAALTAPAAKRYAAQVAAGDSPWNRIDRLEVTQTIENDGRLHQSVTELGVGRLLVVRVTDGGRCVFHGLSPAATWAAYRLAAGAVSAASASRVARSRTTITRQPWRLPPLGANRARSRMLKQRGVGQRLVGELTGGERRPHDVEKLQ